MSGDNVVKTVVVTGAGGFIGRHLMEALKRQAGLTVLAVTSKSSAVEWSQALGMADIIFHLAGVNRPQHESDFAIGNAGLTQEICDRLATLGRNPAIVMTSSIQAGLDNAYGRSKMEAEKVLELWAQRSGAAAFVFRLKNVFGKWCRPNYNSVTATFCYNIARKIPISISDEARELELVYIDDVIASLIKCISAPRGPGLYRSDVAKSYRVTLGELAARIHSFNASRQSLVLPSFADEFTRRLYATYLSYLDGPAFQYRLEQKEDPRGTLAEFMKSAQFGQIFVSRTKAGVTRGNHYHHTKVEKFLVLEGHAAIRFRHIEGGDVIEHRVNGRDFTVVDIPPGYTHSIENIGQGDLVTLFWASEIFDPSTPDTYFNPVRQ